MEFNQAQCRDTAKPKAVHVRARVKICVLAIALMSMATMAQAALPSGIARQLPDGYQVIASAHLAAGQPKRNFEIVALARKDEAKLAHGAQGAPARPLLVFEQKDASFVLTARNDHAVMKADEGGQCDPFMDGNATIATKGRYFTIQNGVACGEHWTDYITFRLDDRSGVFVFDNERIEAWKLNPSNDPDAEALVPAGPPKVIRDRPGHLIQFAAWRRSD